MLPRPRRLSRSGFSGLSHGRRASSAHFLVILAEPARHAGIAVVVSKKVEPRAVDRHLVKRRILSVLAPWCASGRALVVHARRGAKALPYAELRAELTALIHSLIPSRTS